MANKEIITTLEKQKKRLEKNRKKYETELTLIDAEIDDRKKLNKKLINDTDSFLEGSKKSSLGLQAQARKVLSQSAIGIIEDDTDTVVDWNESVAIVIDGFCLIEV